MPVHGELGFWWSALALNPELGAAPGAECSELSDPNSGSGPHRYRRCVRAAESWVAELPQNWKCENLRPRDSLDAFDWNCVEGATVRIESTGLKAKRGLRDFIDSEGQWKPFHVIVEGAPAQTTSQLVQFKNPIRFFRLGSDPPAELNLQKEIIAIDVSSGTRELTQGLRVLGEHLGFTALGSGTLQISESGSLNCRIPTSSFDPQAATDGPVTARALLCIGASRSYFEGKLSGTGNVEVIGTTVGSRRNTFRQVDARRAEMARTAISIRGQDYQVLNLRFACGRIGSSPLAALRLHGAHNMIDGLWIHSCTSTGLSIFSENSLIQNIVVSDSGSSTHAAISFSSEASNNTLFQSKAVHNYGMGIRLSTKGHRLVDVISAHNDTGGIEFDGSSPGANDFTAADARLVNVLAYANDGSGFILEGNPNSVLLNVMSLNNLNSGVFFYNSFYGLDIVDNVLSHNGYRNLASLGEGQSEFFGNLVIPQSSLACNSLGGTGDFGFNGTTCALTGNSLTQTLYHRPTSVDFNSYFQSGSADNSNLSVTNGLFSNPSTTDYYNFDSPFRFVTKNFELTHANQRGRWATLQAKIADLALVPTLSNPFFNRSDSWSSVNDIFVPGGLCPLSLRTSLEHSPITETLGIDGDDDGVCEFGETCQTLTITEYLQLATEIIGDLSGNENGLCERGKSASTARTSEFSKEQALCPRAA